MGFGDAITTCFSKYATFSGRASRSEYWWFVLFGFLVRLVAAIPDAAMSASSGRPQSTGMIGAIVSLAILLPQISVGVRRLHDTDRSGWWYGGFFLLLIVGAVVIVGTMVSARTYGAGSGSPGIIVLFGLAMVAYAIAMFVFTVLKGTDGPNKYGHDPLAPFGASEAAAKYF